MTSSISNAEFLTDIIKNLYLVTRRRTSYRYANETITSSIEWIKNEFIFFNAIHIKEYNAVEDEMNIQVDPQINNVNEFDIGRSLTSFFRLLYTEMNAEVGLFFLTELKETLSLPSQKKLQACDINFEQIQNEQHLLYLRREKLRKEKEGKSTDDNGNQLGYSWKSVASWKHESGSPFCTLYDKNGAVLDRINLDRVIQHYVEKLSGVVEREYKTYTDLQRQVEILEKEYILLKMMHTQDMDADQAAHLLSISHDELNRMIQKLTQVEMIHYTRHDTVELTDKALSYLSDKKEKKT